MDNKQGKGIGLFEELNGAPSQALIVAGLMLVLAAPLLPNFKSARVAEAQTELSQVDTLIEIDLYPLKQTQERERKEDVEGAARDNAAPINYSLGPAEIQRQQQERQARQDKRQARERDRQKALDDKTEELKKKYDSNERKRDLMEAQVASSGVRWHLVLFFLGNLMLLIGLLVLTLESEGARQKVALVILLVVMFSALSGISLNFLATGSLGEHSGGVERLLKQP
jgi:cation transport ATPase